MLNISMFVSQTTVSSNAQVSRIRHTPVIPATLHESSLHIPTQHRHRLTTIITRDLPFRFHSRRLVHCSLAIFALFVSYVHRTTRAARRTLMPHHHHHFLSATTPILDL